ncbi:MAG: A/G-specific adenine glycosylase [Planctomycetota bacterium]
MKSRAEGFPTAALLDWYRQNQRKLPFRPRRLKPGTGDDRGWEVPPNPYHVLVSEAMAQQTQIATVVPYFERFVAAFPTVHDLADADEQRVLTLWQGLGYYRRARNLHAAAKAIVNDHGGEVPHTAEQLLQLPGVGRYTAGAVASVAYDTPAPIVDGNVARVFARYFGIEDAVDRPVGQKQLWQLADNLVRDSGSPRDFNQGVMELGALVCTPKSARCLYCPLRDSCAAHKQGQADRLPVKTPKKKPIAVTHTVLAIRRGHKLLFEQRPPEGLWSNMWQLPTIENESSTPPEDYARSRLNLTIREAAFVDEFAHQTTHRSIRFRLFQCEVSGGRLRPGAGVWRRPNDLADLPLAKPQHAALKILKKQGKTAR